MVSLRLLSGRTVAGRRGAPRARRAPPHLGGESPVGEVHRCPGDGLGEWGDIEFKDRDTRFPQRQGLGGGGRPGGLLRRGVGQRDDLAEPGGLGDEAIAPGQLAQALGQAGFALSCQQVDRHRQGIDQGEKRAGSPGWRGGRRRRPGGPAGGVPLPGCQQPVGSGAGGRRRARPASNPGFRGAELRHHMAGLVEQRQGLLGLVQGQVRQSGDKILEGVGPQPPAALARLLQGFGVAPQVQQQLAGLGRDRRQVVEGAVQAESSTPSS